MAAAPARVLVVNAGSSSLKLRVLDGGDAAAGADLDAPRGAADSAEIKAAIESFGPVDAVGHRVVHGGHAVHRAGAGHRRGSAAP